APDARRALRGHYAAGDLSARGHERVARVARTIADLEGADQVALEHVQEALGFRQAGEPGQARAA
ncbi:MAG: hypothetical protein M3P39_11845, partial [Actinomycetota bacterium]|nr:hypothetical protein [Actinomycetota bacterium]